MPRIGLLSDSHGRALTTRRAVARLLDAGAASILHLGDVGSVEVIDELAVEPPGASGGPGASKPVDVRLVFGNVDWDRAAMARYAEHLGLKVADPVGTLDLANGTGRRLVFTHGDDEASLAAALDDKVAYLCHGHSHRTRDERIGPTRVINPGALFRAKRYTVALLDTDADEVTFMDVDR